MGPASGQSKKSKNQSVAVFELDVGEVRKPVSILMTDLPKTGNDVERISSGTKFAIQQWIKKQDDCLPQIP